MTIDEITERAIPLSFPGVKCAAIINKEREKALIRRVELKNNILTLLQKSAGNNFEFQMDTATN